MDDVLPNEKREYVRAVLSTQAKVRLLSIHEMLQLKSRQADEDPAWAAGLQGPEQEASSVPRAFLSDLAEFLIQLDEKMDRIMAQLNPEGRADPNQVKVKETIDISGSGMRMVMNGKVDVGQQMLISMRMPGFPMGLFRAYGEVVRVEPCSNTSHAKGTCQVGIRFVDVSEDKRERLIAYTFQQQRKKIRGEID